MAKDIVALERELEEVTNEIGRVSSEIEKGEQAHARAHTPSRVLDDLRKIAQQGERIHPSAKQLLEEETRNQRRTELWMQYGRSKLTAQLKVLKLKRRKVQSRLRAAQGRGEASLADVANGTATDTVPVQRPVPLKYRSRMKRAILYVLVGNPDAEKMRVLDICRQMDNDVVDLPDQWKGKKIVTFESAYENPKLRQDIHRWVDKVRTDLKKRGL